MFILWEKELTKGRNLFLSQNGQCEDKHLQHDHLKNLCTFDIVTSLLFKWLVDISR